jgi:hypothetical protein
MKKDAKFITKIVNKANKNDKLKDERLSPKENNSDSYAPAPKRKYKKREPFVPAQMGRPKEFPDSHPVWAEILDRVTSGKSLSSAIKDKGMPVWSTVQLRIATDESFRSKYDDAVQARADRLAEEILELADADMPNWLEGPGASAWVQQKRLQVDARKWVASKLKPRTYGERLDVSVSDNRISVLGALEQAQQRVALGMSKEANVLDVEVKKVKETVEVSTPLAERMDARFSE